MPTLLPTNTMPPIPGATARSEVWLSMQPPCGHNGPVDRANEHQPDRAITSGSDFLQLDAGEAPPGALSAWLAGRLRQGIADGRLPVGGRLPATRVLAAELRVSRGVVTEAYQRLIEDGHVAGRGRAGTIVVAAVPLPLHEAPRRTLPSAAAVDAPGVFDGPPGLDAFDALRAAACRIDLSPGVPDLAAFPRAAWLRAERSVLDRLSASDFGYGDPSGTPALRSAVATWLARNRGIRVDPADVIIVAGVAQALGLICQVLASKGISEIAVEDPCSFGARQHLRNWQLRTPPIAVDSGGLDVDKLRASGAPAVLMTPAHQFPTGVVLEGGRRRDVLRWAAEGGLIIEDDYDAEHRYDRPPVPALRSVVTENLFYTGSVSKWLAPALRIGWLLAPPKYRKEMVGAKRNADLGTRHFPNSCWPT